MKYDEIKAMFDAVVKEQQTTTWEPVKRIGLDEIGMRKGHKHFKTVISDIDGRCLIDVVNTHKTDELIEKLMQQPSEVREAVEEVSIDMWGGFARVVATVFPFALVIYDRFHVMQMVTKRLNQLRKLYGITVRGSRALLLKNNSDLSDEQRSELFQILSDSPCLKIAYEIKEDFRAIYEASKSPKMGERNFKKWLRTAQVFYGDVCQTIQEHLEGICNYFISRTTSGVMEGINNKNREIMRRAYGFKNFDNLRSRLMAKSQYK